jgi:hypothetical protein
MVALAPPNPCPQFVKEEPMDESNPVEVSYEVKIAGNIVTVRLCGPLNGAIVSSARDTAHGHADYRPEMNFLYDLQQATLQHATSDDCHMVLGQGKNLEHLRRGTRTAMVVGTDVDFGMCRMYELLSGSADFRYGVFRDLNEAVAWLSEPAPPLAEDRA